MKRELTPTQLPFEVAEYQRRVQRTRDAMIRQDIDVLLVTDPGNMNYLTGYDGWSFYVHQGVLVFLDLEPIWFGRAQDSNGARLTTWLPEENISGYEDHYVQSKQLHPMEYVADILTRKGYAGCRLGVETDNYYFTGRCLQTLERALPDADIVDGDDLVRWVRSVKSEQEIAYLCMAARITELVMQTAVDNIAPGVREGDVAGEVYKAQICGTEDFTGDYPAIAPIMPSGIRTAAAHLSWTDRRYQVGDVVLLELAGAKHHYNMPLSRTVMVGSPPAELKEIARVVIEGLNKTLDFIRPGVTAEAVEAAWRAAIAGSSVVKESRVGYSFGVNYPPDWGEHTISLRPGDKTVLVPDMTLHFMPGIWLDRFGFECSEPIRITANGCEPFVDFPRQLFCQ
ncbi:MAG: M24 family metallopeptidase [Desulfuromonadales bacterium]